MPDEVIEGQEPQETPEGQSQEPVSSEPMIEVAGRKFKSWDDVGKSYTEAEKRMREVENEKLLTSKQLSELQTKYQWADNWEQYLAANPQKRAEIERVLTEEAAAQQPRYAPDPYAQELTAVKRQLEEMRIDKELDAMAAKGFDMSTERRVKVLEHVFKTGDNDIQGVYKKLFFDDELARVKGETAKRVGDSLAQSQTAYQTPPTGQAALKGKDVKEMSQAELNDAIDAEINKGPLADWFKR